MLSLKKKKDPQLAIIDSSKKILIEQGAQNLTARNISKKANCALGSIYSYFKNIDDLILQINIETVDKLYTKLNVLNVELPDSTEKLIQLTNEYFDFAFHNPEIWGAVMNYQRPQEKAVKSEYTKKYEEKIEQLLNLFVNAVGPLTKPNQDSREMAMLLWASLHGIWQLTTYNGYEKVNKKEAKRMVEIFIKNQFKIDSLFI